MSTRLIKPRGRKASVELTVKQRLFVSEFVANNEFNATKAAKAAGYSCPDKSTHKLLSNPIIQRAIGVELRKRLENNEITAHRVLKELGHIGFLDPREMFNEDDSLKSIRAMPESIRRCIAGIEVKQVKVRKAKDEQGEPILLETSIVKVKLWPKVNALELIAKHLGMLDERFKVEHGVDPQAKAIMRALLEKLENQPSQVIDSSFIEKAAGNLPPIPRVDDELGEQEPTSERSSARARPDNIIDGKVAGK